MKRTRKPSHPGGALQTFVFDALKITTKETAEILGVSPLTLDEVMNEREPLTTDMAKRWGKFTDTSTASWYNMQVALDLWEIENSEMAEGIKPLNS